MTMKTDRPGISVFCLTMHNDGLQGETIEVEG